MRAREVIVWRKSSYSGASGECVEIGWRKSSFSGHEGDCVEVGWQAAEVAVRDSKNPAGPTLSFPIEHWQGFLKK